ncbi:methyl-accepting chemotaxis protein [Clostridium acetobutylicum]|uniref:Methyl-accepting chemotaxis protein, contain HAMP domain n=1 Tax=Clostridium acetobutylicum (strain ATCC 824 / DSM 792 / JCM 1419 / IAM 19013 / LMG 5710 / NBRC 13948 / NRRL B-527 / VKM B-1787 / 2291 / W) TaxID=272562 RepID=Q97KK8_CLOAB|nr:Methyl-accepting chemotaxis protein, contain HAMP domain [Clostridium acetobutylicum ATCC 824]AEI34365.1 methyl-accepting chemotaxis protein [Clostridium acetobutylicum DSM 1731]AWV80604.1 methyl-accepting chemotaxis protein [Clostridium acetobutylicum]PSM06407.1 methyl-accepting chemotaxis protein [Clostridium sp. NJ4]MBC2392794.1 methyl-accepting chemotaxis protein [Clostridium acetobutylicum]
MVKGWRKLSKSIRSKLIITISLVCMIPIIIFGAISYENVYNILMEKLNGDSQQSLTEVNRSINNYFQTMENNIGILAGNYDIQNVNDHPDFEAYVSSSLQEIKENNKDALNVYFASNSKKLYLYPKVNLPEGYDPTTRDWYKNAVSGQGKVIFSEVYVDAATKNSIISISKAVYNNEKLVGVVCMDVDLSKLSNDMKSIKIGREGYIYITDKEGTMIVNPTKSEIGKKNITKSSIWDNINSKKSGFIQYKNQGEKQFVVFKENSELGWKIVGSMNERELTRSTSSVLGTTVVVIIIILALAAIVSILISKTFTKNINKIVEVAKLGADGDLSQKVDITSKDEFGKMADYFNDMIQKIHDLISRIKQSSDNIMSSSKTILTMSRETSSAVDEVAQTIDQVAQGAYSQAEDITNSVNEFNKLGDKITSIKNMTENIDELSKNTNSLSKNGLQIMEVLIDKTMVSNDSSKEVSRTVKDMVETSNAIGNITDTINGISEQTNLLALNAAIEAARAGEAGKGFSVVAEEIGKLAEESTSATKEVKKLLEDIKSKNSVVFKSIDVSLKLSEEQTESVKETKEIFNKILESLNSLVGEIENIRGSINDTYQSKNFIFGKLESISAASEQSASSSEEVSATTEEVSASMSEFNKMSQKLEQVVEELEREIQNFTL